jgi:neutral ceramidase
MVNLPFRAGAAMAEITPPLDVGILMSSVEREWAPFKGVRRPLHARVVVIEGRENATHIRRVAIVALDLLGLCSESLGGYTRFKDRIASAADAGLTSEQLILTSTHTHSAPASLALTDLYCTEAFQSWADRLGDQIAYALRQAVANMCPCRLVAGMTQVPGLTIFRRIKTVDGIVLSHPPPPEERVLSREGPVDESVHVMAVLDEEGEPIALLVNAACHPVHEMCIPWISPDYPGEMSLALESRFPKAVALFLNGAAGNLNPSTVSGGAQRAIEHGQRLAAAVIGSLAQSYRVEGDDIRLVRRTLALPTRSADSESVSVPLPADIVALRAGSIAFLFLPGEIFVEIGLAIRARSPFTFTAVVGFAEDYIGYVPTDEAFEEGGYELGPGAWAKVERGSADLIEKTASALLEQLV